MVDAHEEHPDWRARARELTEREILPQSSTIDRTDSIPAAVVEALGRSGLMGLTIPHDYGGSESRAREVVGVLEEVARGNAAVATLLSVHLSVAAAPIVTWGDADQKSRFLPAMAEGRKLGAFALTEPGAGSDTASLRTQYRTLDGGYRLDGSKMFITNGASADVVVTFATHDATLGHRGVSAFLVEKGSPGYSVAQRLEKLGLRGSETTELVYDDLRLGRAARLGPEGKGLTVALKALTDGRVGIAACALGVAQASLEELIDAARERPSDELRGLVARAYTDVAAARALVQHAAGLKDHGASFVEEASAAKLLAAEAAVRVANLAFEARGCEAGILGARAGQLLRDARVFPIVEGTTEIQELILGRAILGR